jgi:peptidoglycan-associated lipoprotein
MNKSILIGMTALALVTGACGKKTPPAAIGPAVTDPNAGAATNADDNVDLVELPGMQADLVAKAGSDTVYFGTDKSDLDAASRATLAAQARWMLANPSVRGSIEGHADERGTREYNLALGERRANAAKNFLIASGVPAGRLTVISWGKERPAATGSDESAWAQNRRSVTVVVR